MWETKESIAKKKISPVSIVGFVEIDRVLQNMPRIGKKVKE